MSKAEGETGDIEMGNVATTPLQQGGLPEDPETGKGFLKPIPETTAMERVAGLLAAFSVVLSFSAVICAQGSAVVLIAGLLSAVVGPYAYWQQVQLTDIKALQETEDKIRAEVDRLTIENMRLSRNIDKLTENVQGLKVIGDALDVITEQQGQSVQAFAEQVEEQRKILNGMQINLSAKIIDNLLSLAYGADQNDDQIIDLKETEDLIRRIRNMAGVNIKEDKLRAAIQGQTADKVIDVIANLLEKDLPEEDRIFIFRWPTCNKYYQLA